MAIKDIIGAGIGFNPGSLKYIFSRGFVFATPPPNVYIPKIVHAGQESHVLVLAHFDAGISKVVR